VTIRLMFCASLLALSALASGLDAVPDVPPPKSWDKFTIMVWQYQHSALQSKALYEQVNLHGFHVDRKLDANEQAFARETKWPFYIDHAADKGWLHLGDAGQALVKKKNVVVRPHCLADPAEIEEMKGFLSIAIATAKDTSVVGYAFDDEISLGNFCSPVEADGSPLSIAYYQKQLEKMYHDIAQLNAQYGTDYKDFASVPAKSYEEFRGQLVMAGLPSINLSHWCDWRAAMDTQFADCLEILTKHCNKLDPNTPAGFVGGQGPSPYGGYDFRKLCKAVQWVEAYDMGANNEILHSFWTQKRPHVQTWFASGNLKADAWFLWYYLAHGNRGVIAWPEKWFQNGKPADFLVGNAETFKEVQGPLSQRIIDGEFAHDPIAIYYSHPSVQVSWAFDAATHKETWPNRLSSMDDSCSSGANSRIGWVKTLEDIGLQAQFVHSDHLLSNDLQKRGFKVLLLTRTLCLSDEEARAIKDFAAQGGMVIADHCCGIFDEHGKARASGALDELFGVKRDLGKGWLNGKDLSEVDAELDYEKLSEANWAIGAGRYQGVSAVFERGLAAVGNAKGEDAGGTAVMVRNGKNVYMNLSPIGYLLKRSAEGGKAWTSLVAGVLKDAGVEPRVALALDGKPSVITECLYWKNDKRMTLCVINNYNRSATIDGFGSLSANLDGGKVKLSLTFAKPVKDLKNERTGKSMGDGAAFEDEFSAHEANVYSYGE
jgi:hypothetical protein